MALQIDIASPCHESWDEMTGDERVRHCAACKLNVFNTKQMTEQEVIALLASSNGGKVCGRVYRRADGTILTKDCPEGLALLRRRMWMGVSLAVSLVVVLVGHREFYASQRCDTVSGNWFTRVITSRVLAAREDLRDSKYFGPLINEWFPLPVVASPRAVMGKMIKRVPTTPGGPTF